VTLFERVCDYLNARGIAHVLIGAAALAIHGVSRSTFDHDLLLVDDRVLDTAFWVNFETAASVECRRGDDEDPLAGVVRIEEEHERDVDLVVGRYAWQADMLNRALLVAEHPGIKVVQPADLVLLKLYAGGNQDKWDIEQLLSSPAASGLASEVDRRISALPTRCAELWAIIGHNPERQ
jgi:hypothetical protein